MFADHDGRFQFKIQLFKMIGHAVNGTGPHDAVVIGEIKDRVLIELRYHVHLPVAARRRHMLAERVTIAATGGKGYRRH